jgi:hypothetical protein
MAAAGVVGNAEHARELKVLVDISVHTGLAHRANIIDCLQCADLEIGARGGERVAQDDNGVGVGAADGEGAGDEAYGKKLF